MVHLFLSFFSSHTSTCSRNYHAFLYLFQLKATQAGSLYASDSILSTASGSHQCPINLEAVTNCFTNENSLSYCFINDDDVMWNLMLTHGLHVKNLDCTGWEQLLCHHILHRLCAGIPTDSNLK
jgi:hypothetical protein